MSYAAFMTLLRGRDLTVTELCRRAGVPRSHGTQVLLGTRPGGETRAKLARHLTVDERAELGWKAPRRQMQARGEDWEATIEFDDGPRAQRIVDAFKSVAVFLRAEVQTPVEKTP